MMSRAIRYRSPFWISASFSFGSSRAAVGKLILGAAELGGADDTGFGGMARLAAEGGCIGVSSLPIKRGSRPAAARKHNSSGNLSVESAA